MNKTPNGNGNDQVQEIVIPKSVRANFAWENTHATLLRGEWSRARALLDDMNRDFRNEARDMLASAEAYGCPAGYADILGDRIELWNSACERNGRV